jgi:hypothetical protein
MWAYVTTVGKALAAMAVCAAAYLVATLSGDDTLGDVTTVQWLGLVVFMGGAYGLTYSAPYRPTGRRRGVR